jgi:hypothetical protein
MSKNLSATLALSAAALFLGACVHSDKGTASPDGTANGEAPSANIKCFGVNECSGQAACDVPDNYIAPGSVGHACAGANECKGKGWLALPSDECEAQGGTKLES